MWKQLGRWLPSDASLSVITFEVGGGALHASAAAAETLPEELLLATGGVLGLRHASAAALLMGLLLQWSLINNKQTTNTAVSVEQCGIFLSELSQFPLKHTFVAVWVFIPSTPQPRLHDCLVFCHRLFHTNNFLLKYDPEVHFPTTVPPSGHGYPSA